MDSDGSNKDQITEEADKMEVSDSLTQDKKEEMDIITSEKVVTEENYESNDVNNPFSESTKIKDDVLPIITSNVQDKKINTLQTNFEVIEAEKIIDDNKINSVTSSDKESDVLELETIELKLVSPDIAKDDKDIRDSNHAVNNKDIESIKDSLDIEDSCDKQIVPNQDRLPEEQKVEKVEKLEYQSDSKDTKDTKLIINTETTEKKEDIKEIKTMDETKDIENAKNIEDTDNSTADIKDIKDENEIKNIIDDSVDVKEIKVNKIIIKNFKELTEIPDSKELEIDVTEKTEVKTEIIKDVKRVEKVEDKKKVAAIKVKKDLNAFKNNKDEQDLKIKIVKSVKSISDTNMSLNTREGQRKRRLLIKSCEQSSPPAKESQQQSLSQLQQQQQNGSAPKRKRAAAAASAIAQSTVVSIEIPATAPPSKNDKYCWRCHKESVEMECCECPRSWHRRCMGGAPPLIISDWICNECTGVVEAEAVKKNSPAIVQLTVEQLVVMLRHVVQRMREQTGSEPFLKAVDLDEVPNYLEYVINPMDLSLLDSNIRAKKYASTDAFMADAKWIQHNCIVFNTYSSKLTNTAKQMLKVARQEVSEIEACPDCFAHGRNLPKPLPSWFIEPCRRPHPIVWAKLKGFPFWPAKAMPRMNTQGQVDVRFFGEHDRAWISPKDIYLYSLEPPAGTPKKKKFEMEQCIKEVKDHVKKVEKVFGEFKYAPSKILYDPHDPKQIQLSLPYYDPLENKVNKKDNPKIEVQTPAANNKTTTSVKVEKKSVHSKNTYETSTNGVVETTPPVSGIRSLLRKKRALSPKISYDPHDPKQIQLSLPYYDSLENKVNKKDNSKIEVQTSAANNKTTTLVKVEKKSVNSKNTYETNTNGVIETTPPVSGIRSLLRKKRALSPLPQESPPKKASKMSPDVETIVVIPPKKSKSKSPPTATTPTVNNVNDKSINKEVNKSTSTPEAILKQNISATNSNSNTISKPTLVPVKKVRREVIKKIKLTKEITNSEDLVQKPMVVVKTLNISKPATIIHAMPPLNNFPDNIEANPVKIMGTTKKLVSILPKKNQNIGKIMNQKTIQVIQQDGKIVNRMIKTINMPVSKEGAKFSMISPSQPKDKNDLSSSSSNKPMTTIPLSAKKEQKNIFNESNSIISETAKHFSNGEKEIRLNSAVTIIKQEPKDDTSHQSPSIQQKLTIVRKPGKARKSFLNKPPAFPQQTSSSPMTKTSSSDKPVYKQSNDIRPTTSISSTNSVSSIVSSSASSSIYELPPPEAGPATAQIHRYSKEMANKLAQLITNTIRESAESNGIGVDSNSNNHEATIHYLKLKMERLKWEHDQEINEIKHSNDLKLRELKASLEMEHHRALENARREAEMDKRRSIEETKRKQWCVVCGREAMFFCCWNTAYCDYPCQQKHWSTHVNNCAQKNPPTSQLSAPTMVSTPQSQMQKHNSSSSTKQQVMPKLVISKPQSLPVMKKASS